MNQQEIVLLKILLASNVSEIPRLFQETQPHLIESNEEWATKVSNKLSTKSNIRQPEPPLIRAAPIAPPSTAHQTPQSVQQTTIQECINQIPNNTKTHQVYTNC